MSNNRRERLTRTFSLPHETASTSKPRSKPKLIKSTTVDEDMDSYVATSAKISTEPDTPPGIVIDRTFRRRSLFAIPFFSPLRRRSFMTSKKSYSCESSPNFPQQTPPKKNTGSPRLNSCQQITKGGDDMEVCGTPKHPSYTDCDGEAYINMTTGNDAELMVSADEFIARSGLSERKKTNSKLDKKSTLPHNELMRSVQRDTRAEDNDMKAVVCTDIDKALQQNNECNRNEAESSRMSPCGVEEDDPLDSSSSSLSTENASQTCLDVSDNNREVCKENREISSMLDPNVTSHFAPSPGSTRAHNHSNSSPRHHLVRSYSESAKRGPRKHAFKAIASSVIANASQQKNCQFCSQISDSTEDYVHALYGDLKCQQCARCTGKDLNNNGLYLPLNTCGTTADSCSSIASADAVLSYSPNSSMKRNKLFGFSSSPKHRKSPSVSPKKSPSKTSSPRRSRSAYDFGESHVLLIG